MANNKILKANCLQAERIDILFHIVKLCRIYVFVYLVTIDDILANVLFPKRIAKH